MIKEKGQALIIVIFGIAIAITILTGAVVTAITLGKNARLGEDAQSALLAAESGGEVALEKLVRDPNSCSGTESLSVNSASVTISYSLAAPNCTIVSTAQMGTLVKKIQIIANLSSNKVTYSSWKEIP
ncbi:MAG TPA: hypothetical protein VLE47_02510 [Candidatus Saccharimonadales bacterium]|nr:hypothetical protein [Candidatus Saccharimonadales bacterium]